MWKKVADTGKVKLDQGKDALDFVKFCMTPEEELYKGGQGED